jgi:hypothetical protein
MAHQHKAQMPLELHMLDHLMVERDVCIACINLLKAR